jgi:hypothetical protein
MLQWHDLVTDAWGEACNRLSPPIDATQQAQVALKAAELIFSKITTNIYFFPSARVHLTIGFLRIFGQKKPLLLHLVFASKKQYLQMGYKFLHHQQLFFFLVYFVVATTTTFY